MHITKAQIHSILESLIHSTIKDGSPRHAKVVIPYHELARELGFGDMSEGVDVLITIKAELIDEIGEEDDQEESKPASKN